ncbi:formin-like protein 5 [Juglans microcarpa x Juglans regia]|uniref:formin-like protein 5 n=1 Tax=Juglans microcarpa x Juglans regia TaxID=2249226 RepID=UPI001B7E81D0|nr:formin-like protein 5 [Juglans microcarpa x Juglans regia]
MIIQQLMDLIKTSSFIVLVSLLFTLAAVSSEERNNDEEVFLRQLVDPASGEINEDMVEVLWINCRQDLIHLREAVKDLNLCFLDEKFNSANDINSRFQSLAKENIQKIISVLHPQLKRTLLDCLRKNNILFHVSGEEGGSKIWYAKYLGSLYTRPNAPRRHLGAELLQISETPSPAPAVGPPISSPTPSPDPAPSPAPVPFSSPAPNPQSPAVSPGVPFFPPNFSNSTFQSSANDSFSGSPSNSNVQENKQSNSHKSVVIAVAVTASVTFVVVALFFLCYTKVCSKGSRARRNDERPLLSLSLNDFSVGSSTKSSALGNTIKEEKLQYQSFGNAHIESGFLHGSPESLHATSSITGQVPPLPLKPPPGRLGTTTSVLLPQKSPPDRADPLPPEPRSSFRPPPSKTAPPPPPLPPPSLKPSSSGSGPRPPGPPPPPPPIPLGIKTGSRPPPPPKSGVPPPRPPQPIALGSKVAQPPPGPKRALNAMSSEEAGLEGDTNAPKAKLKPFFWDKVLASPDQSMVWHQIKSGSFQFNEEMIETLFGYNAVDKSKNERRKESSSQDPSPQYIQIIDPKKSQNLSILLRALNVTIEEVCDALHEGNELPPDFVQTLLKMAPTADEELKLRLFSGELSQLGPADRFLKALVDIPFAFKRLEALLFMCTLQEEATITKESFATLEVACKELRNSRLFLKLLEAVLKTGNRMNDGTFRGGAQAFKLDTLLKLSDVKGVDGKTTLLNFVVQEIIRSEGVRAARGAKGSQSFSSFKSDDLLEETSHDTEEHYRSLGLQVVSALGNELENVKKAAILDADSLTGTVAKLGQQLIKTRDFLNSDMKSIEEDRGFHQTLKSFVQNAEIDVMWFLEEERRIMTLVKSTGDYFHGKAGKDEGLRLFVIVRDFLIMLDKACKDVRDAVKRRTITQKKEAPTVAASSDTRQPLDLHQRLFPAITDRRIDSSSSDDESP